MLGRKGSSEVIATMLLILIAVAASVLLYVYASGLMGSLQGHSQSQPYLEQVSLDYYDWTTLSTLKLTLRNVGSTVISIASADFFVNGQPVTQTGCSGTLGVQGSTSSTCTATIISIGFTATSGIAYTVKVVTNDGAVFSYSCIAGQAA